MSRSFYRSRRQIKARRGIGLVELLVAIAIIVLLVAVSLPAIQAARESARNLQCKNKLRQIALAAHQYENIVRRLPSGQVSLKPGYKMNCTSFLVHLLPYVEQAAIYDRAVVEHGRVSIESGPFRLSSFSTPVALLGCPSDARVPGPQPLFEDISVALTSYVGCSGTNHAAADGLLYLDSAVRISEATDGAANTLLLGERPPSSDYWWGWWYGGAPSESGGDFILGAAELNYSPRLKLCATGPYHFAKGDIENHCDTQHFWAPHPGGANFAFADGSVRFITYDAAEILPKLATRAGGEPVSAP